MFFPLLIILMNFFAALSAETMGKFLAGPFTIGVSMKPGHIGRLWKKIIAKNIDCYV